MRSIKLIFLTVCLVSFGHLTYSQVVCNPNYVTTYQNPWDWKAGPSTWDISINGNPPSPITNPFYNGTSNPNLIYLAAPLLKDYSEEDGWEVVIDGRTSSTTSGYPVFVFYNKFNARLRVFVLLTSLYGSIGGVSVDQVGGFIYLTHVDDNGRTGTAYLSQGNQATFALDRFNVTAGHKVFNHVVNFPQGQYYWLYADFPLNYDPCVCWRDYTNQILPPAFNVQVCLNNQSSFNFTARSNIIDGVVQNGNVTANKHTSVLSDLNEGLGTYDDALKLISDLSKATDDLNPGPEKDKSKAEATALTKAAEFVKMIPKYGAVISKGLELVNFFINGGKKSDDAKNASAGIVDLRGNGGTFGQIQNYGYKQFYTPSAEVDPTLDPAPYPIYNNSLGIFNLFKTPKVNYYEYSLPCSNPHSSNPEHDDHDKYLEFEEKKNRHKVQYYKLDGDAIKFVLNPPSQLTIEDIDHIEASWVIKLREKWVQPGISDYLGECWGNHLPLEYKEQIAFDRYNYNESLAENLRRNFMELSLDPINNYLPNTFRTPWVPLNCLRDIRFKVFRNQDQETPEIYLQVKVILKRNDQFVDPQTQDVLFLSTYQVDVEKITGTGPFTYSSYSSGTDRILNLDPPNPWNMVDVFEDYVVDPVFSSGQTVPLNLKAHGTVQINSGAIILPGSNIEATRQINVIPSNNLLPFLNMKIVDLKAQCDYTTDLSAYQPTETELIDYCRGNVYEDLAKYSKKGGEHPFDDETHEVPLQIFAYPNPVNETLYLSGLDPGESSITIFDMSGKQMLSRTETPDSESKIPIETSFLAPGVYILNVQVGKRQKNIKFVKVN
ncbi:MAG TPA: hypothetical protein DIW47_04065 [Bacteroidetes bacterium]|nr:hypothetical protein [Bacteroidota bacterium]